MADWQCARSGDCCRDVGGVTMTPGELAAVRAVSDRPHVYVGGEVFRVDGRGCPWWEDGCTVYAVRPGVCRAYGCFRRPGEPFAGMPGMIARMRDSRGVQRVALRMLEEAEAWTREHD